MDGWINSVKNDLLSPRQFELLLSVQIIIIYYCQSQTDISVGQYYLPILAYHGYIDLSISMYVV